MILKIGILISLKSITGLISLLKMELVLCQVGTEFLCIVEMKLRHENACNRTYLHMYFLKNGAAARVGTAVYLISKETT